MSEKMPVTIESPVAKSEKMPTVTHEKIAQNIEKNAEKMPASNREQDLSKIRQNVAEKASSTSETIASSSSKERTVAPQTIIDSELKDMMFTRTLNRVQRHLNPAQKVFSKTIHSKAVDTVSTIGEKTIARPVGLIFGGLFALLGSVFSAYLAKQFGMRYNPVVFCVFFLGGYVVGLVIELILRIIRKPL